jgi:hypothetical protein
MIKKNRDLVVLILVVGLLFLLTTITIGDFYVCLKENKPIDESIVTLLKMSISGIVGIVAGYVSNNSRCCCNKDD